ncbi:DUF5947 family protein [Wenjunlia tyrosinilytica]|uniref:Uncharacterized protein n=1 Tax=Wenjunlia tyrosinilytica TaxID=1544741 RepID=A0A917ZPF7_9ACTN|nr:DUF5947 family protein [Wenjunlia tyrosinilytica]GGO87930.1 hypothetical protein GCM10012280_27540 [Wenjunlia tyrosinilytica]
MTARRIQAGPERAVRPDRARPRPGRAPEVRASEVRGAQDRGGRGGEAGPPTGPAALRRFTRRPAGPAEERCDLCGETLPPEHRHLVDTRQRALKCSCVPCHMLFTRPGAGSGRFRAVPDRYLRDPDFTLDDADWNRLQIPVALVFFFRNSDLGRLVAFYPSPAGATESELDPQTWDDVIGGSRLAQTLEPDVEALLVHREKGEHGECFLVPIDTCYELVGRMRLHWQGFDGGAEARADLAEFFQRVREHARPCADAEGSTP